MKTKPAFLSMLCLTSLLTSCNLNPNKELTKKEIMNFIKNIDTTNNYNYSTDESTLVSFKVEASKDYLRQIGQNQEEFYESYYKETTFYDYDTETFYNPEIGVKYFGEIPNQRIYDPTYLDDVSLSIDYYLESGVKYYLKKDCLVEVIPMYSQPNSSYDRYEQYIGDIDMLWTSDKIDNSNPNRTTIKIKQNEKELIILEGACTGFSGDIRYFLIINEENNTIEKFDILSHHENSLLFGSEEEMQVEDYLNGFALESENVDLDFLVGATYTKDALEKEINARIEEYKEIKSTITWKQELEERREYVVERHIDKEGMTSVFNEYKKTDFYQYGTWCYSIEIKCNSNLFDHKWIDE